MVRVAGTRGAVNTPSSVIFPQVALHLEGRLAVKRCVAFSCTVAEEGTTLTALQGRHVKTRRASENAREGETYIGMGILRCEQSEAILMNSSFRTCAETVRFENK